MIIKDWKKYYTLEEAKAISDIEIEKNAKKFAKKVLEMQKKYREEKREEKVIIKFEDKCLV